VLDITESKWFEFLIMLVVMLNTVTMTLDLDYNSNSAVAYAVHVLDEIFLAIYYLEFLMKVYAQPVGYWRDRYNVFNWIILVLSTVMRVLKAFSTGSGAVSVAMLRGFRILRALCSFRTLRAISAVKGLQVRKLHVMKYVDF